VALALVLLGCPSGEAPPNAGAPQADARQPAPEFSLPRLGGGEVSLAELRGRPVVLDFWATWCPPCVHQIPVLNAFHDAHGDEVAVLGISVDTDGPEAVAAFAAEHEIRYPVLLAAPELARRYGAIGFPTLYVIDAEGGIARSHVGIVSEEELSSAIEGLGG
jgi:peroxiredoxin